MNKDSDNVIPFKPAAKIVQDDDLCHPSEPDWSRGVLRNFLTHCGVEREGISVIIECLSDEQLKLLPQRLAGDLIEMLGTPTDTYIEKAR